MKLSLEQRILALPLADFTITSVSEYIYTDISSHPLCSKWEMQLILDSLEKEVALKPLSYVTVKHGFIHELRGTKINWGFML